MHAVFVTVDPERDTTTWLKEYVRYLPAGFVALTGTADQIRATADAWGARYARVEGATPDTYSMSHTADVYLVDANGMLRARFPFGTGGAGDDGGPAPGGRDDGAGDPEPERRRPVGRGRAADARRQPDRRRRPRWTSTVVSSSVWAGSSSPVILTLTAGGAPLNDADPAPDRRSSRTPSAQPVGDPVEATPVQPPGVDHGLVRRRAGDPGAGRLADRRHGATRGGTTPRAAWRR